MKKKKIGTITLAVGLIILGLALFINNFTDIGIKDIYKYWPVLLIGLGIEMLVFTIIYRQEENVKLRIDGLCIVFIAVVIILSSGTWLLNLRPDISLNPFQGEINIGGINYKDELKETIVKDNVSKDITIEKLIAKNRFGDVELKPHDKDYIRVEADVRVKYNDLQAAREYINDLVKIKEGQETEIYCEDYNAVNKSKYGRATVDFVIYVPKGVYTDVSNSFGDITVKGMTKDVVIYNQHGQVNVSQIEGNVDIDNSFGEVEAKEIKGKLDVRNQHGDIEADFIEGDVEAETGFGDMEIGNVTGQLIARNNYGKVTVKDVKGDVELKTSFGDIEASDIDGNAVMNDNNGYIKVKEIAGDAEIRNSFGKISYSSSNLNNAEIYAKTTFGDIKTDLPLSISKSINENTARGKLGEGKYKIELITNNGEIEIK